MRYCPTKQYQNEWLASTLSQDPRAMTETPMMRLVLTPSLAIINEEGREKKKMTMK